MTCPLCKSDDVKAVDHISKDRLRSVYLREYQTDIAKDVTSDMTAYHCQSCDLKYFDPAFTGSQSFYSDLQKFDWYYKDDKFEYDYVAKLIKSKDKVLEVGCGKGAFSALIPSKKYVGLEFSETARDQALLLGRDVRTQSIEDHSKLNEQMYDVVCSFQVIEHTSDPKSFLEGCIRSLKPNGTLILTVPSENSFLEHIQDFALNMPPHHVTKWSDQCLTNLASKNGLELVDLYHEPLNSFHIRWFFTSMVVYQLNKTVGIKHSLLKSPRHWLSHTMAELLYKLIGNLPNAYHGHGHTVIAVYKKSANGTPPKNALGRLTSSQH